MTGLKKIRTRYFREESFCIFKKLTPWFIKHQQQQPKIRSKCSVWLDHVWNPFARFNTTLPSPGIIFNPHRRRLTPEKFKMLTKKANNFSGWVFTSHVFELDREQVSTYYTSLSLYFCCYCLQFCFTTVSFNFLFFIPVEFKLSTEPWYFIKIWPYHFVQIQKVQRYKCTLKTQNK